MGLFVEGGDLGFGENPPVPVVEKMLRSQTSIKNR